MKTTHFDIEAGNIDLYNVSKCQECGKVIQTKVNTIYGGNRTVITARLEKLPTYHGDEICEGDCAQ